MTGTLDFKKQTLFGFYGSLRKGEYNYMGLMKHKEGVVYLETTNVPHYKLYSLGSYPVALKTQEEGKYLTLDLFKITNEEVKNRIDRMEVGAGYLRTIISIESTDNPGEFIDILTYTGSDRYNTYVDESKLIPDGNWANRNMTRRITNVD